MMVINQTLQTTTKKGDKSSYKPQGMVYKDKLW